MGVGGVGLALEDAAKRLLPRERTAAETLPLGNIGGSVRAASVVTPLPPSLGGAPGVQPPKSPGSRDSEILLLPRTL